MEGSSENVEDIVRRIVRKMLAVESTDMKPQPQGATLCLGDRRLITLADLEGKLRNQTEVAIASNAVITPAAKDLLHHSAINIVRKGIAAGGRTVVASSGPVLVADINLKERGLAFAKQLEMRTHRKAKCVDRSEATIVLSDLPQPVVCDLCRDGSQAVQVGSLAEAKAVALAMRPTTWVFDMGRLNLVSAVNVARYVL